MQTPTLAEFMSKIDFNLLKQQKSWLCSLPNNGNEIEGLLNFIDYVQDTAVDHCGYNKHTVFTLTEEEAAFVYKYGYSQEMLKLTNKLKGNATAVAEILTIRGYKFSKKKNMWFMNHGTFTEDEQAIYDSLTYQED